MAQLSEDDFAYFAEQLGGSERHLTLRNLMQDPTGDTRIPGLIEPFLLENTPCVVSLPYVFGEMRWLAAHALAAERSVLQIDAPVRLLGVALPLETELLSRLGRAAESNVRSGTDGLLETLAELGKRGLLPRFDLELPEPSRGKPLQVDSLYEAVLRAFEWPVVAAVVPEGHRALHRELPEEQILEIASRSNNVYFADPGGATLDDRPWAGAGPLRLSAREALAQFGITPLIAVARRGSWRAG